MTRSDRGSIQTSPQATPENHGAIINEFPALPHRSGSEPGPLSTVSLRQSVSSSATDETLVKTVVSTSTRRSSRSKETEDPLGLCLIHGTSNSNADFIFVHGLGGSSRKTWSWEHNPDNFWPAWIQHEQGLSNFRVFSYGYNANFKDSDTPLSILDFSKGLLLRMRTYDQTDGGSSIGIVSYHDCLVSFDYVRG